MLIQLEGDFWRHVQECVPPALDGSEASAKFLSSRFPDSVPRSKIKLPDTAAELLRQYDDASEKVERYTEQKREAENLLKQMLGDNEAGIAGERLITWKSEPIEGMIITMAKTSLVTGDTGYVALTTNALDIISENLKKQPLPLSLFDVVRIIIWSKSSFANSSVGISVDMNSSLHGSVGDSLLWSFH